MERAVCVLQDAVMPVEANLDLDQDLICMMANTEYVSFSSL